MNRLHSLCRTKKSAKAGAVIPVGWRVTRDLPGRSKLGRDEPTSKLRLKQAPEPQLPMAALAAIGNLAEFDELSWPEIGGSATGCPY